MIEGDGNCFFRAVIKGLTPFIPRDHEDSRSLELRKLVNSLEKVVASVKEFEVEDESDTNTMSKAGVWADHIQIAKVATFLNRQIWLMRCDDKQLQMEEDGTLKPVDIYKVGPESKEEPILLYYQVCSLALFCFPRFTSFSRSDKSRPFRDHVVGGEKREEFE